MSMFDLETASIEDTDAGLMMKAEYLQRARPGERSETWLMEFLLDPRVVPQDVNTPIWTFDPSVFRLFHGVSSEMDAMKVQIVCRSMIRAAPDHAGRMNDAHTWNAIRDRVLTGELIMAQPDERCDLTRYIERQVLPTLALARKSASIYDPGISAMRSFAEIVVARGQLSLNQEFLRTPVSHSGAPESKSVVTLLGSNVSLGDW